MDLQSSTENPAARLPEIHRRLCAEYGCPVAYFGARDPLSQLVSSLLSQRTANKNKSIAFKALRDACPTWESVRDAPVEQLQDLIRVCTWPEQKAPALKRVLNVITERVGALSLEFLKDLSPDAARRWLLDLPGIGPKTAAAVLSFSNMRLKALPVDVHHFRVAARLDLVPLTMAVGKAHDVLEAMLPHEWTAQDFYDHHEVMMFHGQRCCFIKSPRCERCPCWNFARRDRSGWQSPDQISRLETFSAFC